MSVWSAAPGLILYCLIFGYLLQHDIRRFLRKFRQQ